MYVTITTYYVCMLEHTKVGMPINVIKHYFVNLIGNLTTPTPIFQYNIIDTQLYRIFKYQGKFSKLDYTSHTAQIPTYM